MNKQDYQRMKELHKFLYESEQPMTTKDLAIKFNSSIYKIKASLYFGAGAGIVHKTTKGWLANNIDSHTATRLKEILLVNGVIK